MKTIKSGDTEKKLHKIIEAAKQDIPISIVGIQHSQVKVDRHFIPTAFYST